MRCQGERPGAKRTPALGKRGHAAGRRCMATHPQRTALRAGGGGGSSYSLTSLSKAARGRVLAGPHEP